jgi:hypothetical protein
MFGAPLRFPLDVERLLHCPVCEFDYTHPTLVEVNAGGKITRITADGNESSIGPAAGRGVRITLGFVCEEGHGFEVDLHFHKGCTGFTARQSLDVPSHTIWRD